VPLATSSSASATLSPEEPSQASIRALLEELTGEPLPPGGTPVAIDEHEPGEGDVSASTCTADRPSTAHALATSAPRVAYILPGLPPEGSGGSHSLVQEARGMRALGADVWVCVPEESLARASTLYGNDDELFAPYPDEGSPLPGVSGASVGDAVGNADVAVATEYPSVDLLARLARARPGLVCAYYVQDYEPLFAAAASSRADRALLSYRAIPDQLLFAKTHWLGRLVRTVHGTPVAKVCPSLDRELFHARDRLSLPQVPRVAAMIRPRTPRRRPAATLAALAIVAAALGEEAQVVTFGCDEESFALLGGRAVAGVHHFGLLTRAAVAGLMRSCEVFLDGSAYQAFGRTGLEAMACGAVPILPALGGVHEYARHDENAVILDEGSPGEMAAAIVELVRDTARLGRLQAAGIDAARDFSIERAARSQLDLFAAAAMQ
jgi:Glycosyl transferases group 1